jgi:hypothetical protein
MNDTTTVSPLRPRMIEDMAARKLNPHTQRSHMPQAVRRLAQAFARYGNARRGPPISVVSRRERHEHLQSQSDHDRGAVLVPRRATSPRGLAHQGAREAAQKVLHGNWKTVRFIAALRNNRVTAPFCARRRHEWRNVKGLRRTIPRSDSKEGRYRIHGQCERSHGRRR